MASRALGTLGWALGLWLSACGSNVTYSGNTGSSGSGTGSGIPLGPGSCSGDSDCPGGSCAVIGSAGPRVCVAPPPPQATQCHSGVGPDQCCTSKDCKTGGCYDSAKLPSCGGPAMALGNRCYADECSGDAGGCVGEGTGIANWVCLPAGAFGFPQRRCLRTWCRLDSDCGASPGGACRTMSDGCCGFPMSLACVYPGGCTKDADCGNERHCDLGVCKSGARACPS